jgi:hypothetical protein
MTKDKQQLWWQRGNNGAATNSKQQSTIVQHAQRQNRDNGRMRWKMMAAEEMRWTVSGRKATTALPTMTKNNNQQVCGGKGG